jgi:hypothetical protein
VKGKKGKLNAAENEILGNCKHFKRNLSKGIFFSRFTLPPQGKRSTFSLPFEWRTLVAALTSQRGLREDDVIPEHLNLCQKNYASIRKGIKLRRKRSELRRRLCVGVPRSLQKPY